MCVLSHNRPYRNVRNVNMLDSVTMNVVIGVTAVQKVGGRSEARRAESGGGVLGEGAASPSPPARGSGRAL